MRPCGNAGSAAPQDGRMSESGPFVIFPRPLPSAFMTKISLCAGVVVVIERVNAIRAPSGDHEGLEPVVKVRGLVPSKFISQISPRSSLTKAIVFPSGENAGTLPTRGSVLPVPLGSVAPLHIKQVRPVPSGFMVKILRIPAIRLLEKAIFPLVAVITWAASETEPSEKAV